MTDEVSPFLQRVIAASDERRPGLITRLINQRLHGSPHVPEIRSWTHDELLDAVNRAANKHNTLSHKLLQELHDARPKSFPSPATVESLSGAGWSGILAEAGVSPVRTEPLKTVYAGVIGKPPKHDVLYFLDLYRRFGLHTKELYLEARRRYPEIVPPYTALVRTVGGMRGLNYLVRLESYEEQLKAIVTLMHELGGRWPRKQLCRQHAIDRRFLEGKFGGKIELEELCRELLPHFRAALEEKKTDEK